MSKSEKFDDTGNVSMTGITSRELSTEILALRELADSPFAANLIGYSEDAENVHLVSLSCGLRRALLLSSVAVTSTCRCPADGMQPVRFILRDARGRGQERRASGRANPVRSYLTACLATLHSSEASFIAGLLWHRLWKFSTSCTASSSYTGA